MTDEVGTMATQAQAVSRADAIAAVYAETLPAVWRYVRSRIPADDAEDVTSDVYARALTAWDTYEPAKGTPTAWLCGVAHRTVADWWRRRSRAPLRAPTPAEEQAFAVLPASNASPEDMILHAELLTNLSHRLSHLSEREREVLGLRFAAGLKAAEIAQLLDLSVGATKMILYRTLAKLREVLFGEAGPAEAHVADAETLDMTIQRVLDRRGSSISDPLLERLVQCLALVHEVNVPPGLAERVAACLSCLDQSQGENGGARGGTVLGLNRLTRAGPLAGFVQAVTAPACVVCAAGPSVTGAIMAAGLTVPALVLHEALWVLAPLNLAGLWLGFRRHGQPAALLVAGVGVALILLHLYSHTPVFGRFFRGEVVLGSILLAAAVVIDWWQQRTARLPSDPLLPSAGSQ